nr:TetR/AcrR family transcriptional regulator [Propionibacterium sp.]
MEGRPTTVRRRRLSDAETERLMLDTAVEEVLTRGLPVGLDRLGFEEIIRRAGVSRTAVYRKWRTREDFYARLLLELAGHDQHGVRAFSAERLPQFLAFLATDPDWRRTPEGRRATFVELCRRGVEANLDHRAGSAGVGLLVALVALLQSTERLHDEILAALTVAEDDFRRTMGGLYATLGRAAGVRPRYGADWATVASLGSALVVGGTVQGVGNALLRSESRPGDPFGTGRTADWTTLSLGYTALLLSLTEPDPDFDPDATPASLAAPRPNAVE